MASRCELSELPQHIAALSKAGYGIAATSRLIVEIIGPQGAKVSREALEAPAEALTYSDSSQELQ